MDGCCYFLEDFPGASTTTRVCTPLNATGTLHMRKDHFSTSATAMGNQLSFTKSFAALRIGTDRPRPCRASATPHLTRNAQTLSA